MAITASRLASAKFNPMTSHYIALYAGMPVKLHTNLCGKWFAMTDEIHATKFKCEQTAVSQCALHGAPHVQIVPIDLVADYAANKPTDCDLGRVVTISLTN